MRYLLTVLCIIVICHVSYCQDTDAVAELSIPKISLNDNINSEDLDKLNKQYSDMAANIQSRTSKMLDRLEKRETKLKNKLQQKDSSRAQHLFAYSGSIYQKLRMKLQAAQNGGLPVGSLNSYMPGLDSMNTATKFLQLDSNAQQLNGNKLQQVQALNGQTQNLQAQLQAAGDVQEFAKQREQQLKDQLSSYGLDKDMLGMNKDVYYYQQQLEQYKSMLGDRQKLQDAALGAIQQLPAFQSFVQKSSWLAMMFPAPAANAPVGATVGANASVAQELQQRFGGLSTSPTQYIQGQVVPTANQLGQLQQKISGTGSLGSSTDIAMPDFTPNNQKVKTFFQRLEYGFNIQSQKTNYMLPTTSQLALTLGYKLSDKATVGVGASYNIGWGSGLNNISLSSQGVSFRSFIDIKAKGSIWVTGGWEYNYLQAFSKLSAISNLDVWQKSALIGLTKKTKVGKQTCNLQLLYDLLSEENTPQTQPLIFRIGYSF
jgi:hypothetical protein